MVEAQTLRFGSHDLQELLVWLPAQRPPSESCESCESSRFWIILVHGGAWRDPTITHLNFAEPAVSILLSPSSPVSSILKTQHRSLAIASLSYRLSPHPSHPQDCETTPETSLRNARHPDHIDDVCAGLALLKDMYGLTEQNYMLVGHSCGATLAFQALLRSRSRSGPGSDTLFPSPGALVGLAGIYDLRLLLDNHKDGLYGDIYTSFIEGAFGKRMDDWDRASPTHFSESDMYSGRTVLLVAARGDELVEPEQRDAMRRTVLGPEAMDLPVEEKSSAGESESAFSFEHKGCRYAQMSVDGGHDDMWLVGQRIVAAIERALQIMTAPTI
ncbi:hypothetical protein A1O3_03446 [Capronia epimyces CBS 606.96]|uniref:Kynurenine formamidase n=1 Tax=Capronia epimyces CBS 606.96 TaxID=1182542 RepID=W9YA25_9EURO|nr:uncharacterized protein A1O3_03446 [Capronia epimyces CBS 606.96]EXJ86495.1 hypothetical protein A1O3_03446 [Capronia epimyces CBS 606.96]